MFFNCPSLPDLISAHDITAICIQLHTCIYISLVFQRLFYLCLFYNWVIFFSALQGWVPLPTVPHHASGNKKYRTTACVSTDCPFQHPQWAGMCYQHQPCKCYPSARQPQWVSAACFVIGHYQWLLTHFFLFFVIMIIIIIAVSDKNIDQCLFKCWWTDSVNTV